LLGKLLIIEASPAADGGTGCGHRHLACGRAGSGQGERRLLAGPRATHNPCLSRHRYFAAGAAAILGRAGETDRLENGRVGQTLVGAPFRGFCLARHRPRQTCHAKKLYSETDDGHDKAYSARSSDRDNGAGHRHWCPSDRCPGAQRGHGE
jgi:hypothetical protein